MSRKGKLTRGVTNKECPWLGKDLRKGKVVYEFTGCTYGCIKSGIAVSDKLDKTPFYEIPKTAVEWDTPNIEEQVQSCTSIEEVRNVVKSIGGVQGSRTFYTPDQFNYILDKVCNEEYTVMHITRTHGLRKKVSELLMA